MQRATAWTPASRASSARRVLAGAACALAGATLLAAIGPPADLAALAPYALAVTATELLLLDFPDRRGVTIAILPVLLAAGAFGAPGAVWAAALGALAAGLLLRRPMVWASFGFARAALAATVALGLVEQLRLGALGSSVLAEAAPAALVAALGFSATSELLTFSAERLRGDRSELDRDAAPISRVDLVASLALAPLAVAAWSLSDRLGTNGLLAAAGGLLALLAVVRSAVNTATHHSELRRLHAAVDRERERLETLLAYSGEGIFVVDPDGCVSRVNRELEALSGISEADTTNRHVHDVFDIRLTSGESLGDALARVRTGAPLLAEATLRRPGGDERDILLSYARVPDRDGRSGGIGVIRDITAMRQAQRDRDDFIAVMTHDLRQPLTGLLGYTQLLEGGLSRGLDPERGRKYLDGIRRGGEHMLRMVNNLLDIAHIESGRIEIELNDVRLADLAAEVTQSLEASASAKRLAVQVDVPETLPRLRTSEALLRESLANLMGNAVKYTPEGGSVRVSARRVADEIVLTVADTGIGIPADELPRVFSRFFRTSQAEVRQLRGSGLGLALTKMMIERVGGRISVESEMGVGTTFSVTMPVDPAAQLVA